MRKIQVFISDPLFDWVLDTSKLKGISLSELVRRILDIFHSRVEGSEDVVGDFSIPIRKPSEKRETTDDEAPEKDVSS